jgi:hypothetical protein
MAERSPQAVLEVLARHQQLHGCLYRGRLQSMPAKRSRRLMLLSEVAQVFEPGIRYPEPVVNDRLRVIHPDYAALRRYLVDEDFMDRADGQYWRTGGPVSPSA